MIMVRQLVISWHMFVMGELSDCFGNTSCNCMIDVEIAENDANVSVIKRNVLLRILQRE